MLCFIDLAALIILNIFIAWNFWQSIWLAVLICIFLYAMRVYETDHSIFSKQLSRTAIAVFLSVLVFLLFRWIIEYEFSWKMVLFNISVCFAVLIPLRIIVFRILSLAKKKYYLVCNGQVVDGFLSELQNANSSIVIEKIRYVPENAKNIVFDSEKTMKFLNGKAKNYKLLPDLIEKYLRRIPVELVMAYPEYYKNTFNKKHNSIAKRILNVVIAALALVILSPIMLVIAIAIYLEDGGPIIFKQQRVGENGKIFTVYKFRSMRNTNTQIPLFADQEKDRITKVGNVIRKLRMDEIPQFLNVLKGDMNVVGPRPEYVGFHNEMSKLIPFFDYRLKVKPGITGWAQVNYRHTSNVEQYKKKLEYDLWYVKNASFWTDLRIMLYTLETIIFRKGAV